MTSDTASRDHRTRAVNPRIRKDALIDQIVVRVDPEAFEYYLAVLDRPPSGEGLARLMQVPKPWAP